MEKKVDPCTSEELNEMIGMNQFQIHGNQRGGRRLEFQLRKPNNQDKSNGSGRKHHTGGKRKNGLGNQGRLK